MEKLTVEQAGPVPLKKGAGRPPGKWAVMLELAVGEAVDVPEDVKINTINRVMGYYRKTRSVQFARRGRRVWRIT